MPRTLRHLVAAGALTALTVAAGVAVVGPDAKDPVVAAPDVEPASLQQLETTSVTVARAGFCDRIDPGEVEAALTAPPTDAESYGDGDPVRFTPRVEDIAHEFGCVWSRGGQRLRAWVFAPPVSQDRATDLVAAARATRDCSSVARAAEFGAPSVALVCKTGKGRQVSFRGLFGDAWLSCSVVGRVPGPQLIARASRFCAAVVLAAEA